MPYPTEHAARIVNPDTLDPKSIRRVNDKFGPGIDVIFGKPTAGPHKGAEVIQAIRFNADKFTAAAARKWCKDNDFKPIEFEPATGDNKDKEPEKSDHKKFATEDLDGEEVFSTGKWTDSNGQTTKYEDADLQGMADAANETSYASKPIKLGHNNKQDAAKNEFGDGGPTLGTMKNFRVVNHRLVTDLKQVPAKLASLIRAGAYKFKSLEIKPKFVDEANGKTYKYMPVGLALLGEKMPAVSNLKELCALFEKTCDSPESQFYFSLDGEDAVNFSTSKEGENMTDQEKKEMDDLKAANADMKRKLDAAGTDGEEMKKKLAKSEKDCADAKAELSKFKADKKDGEGKDGEGKSEHAKEILALQQHIEAQDAQIQAYGKRLAGLDAEKFDMFLEQHTDKLTPEMKSAFKLQYELCAENEKSSAVFTYSKDGKDYKGVEAIKQRIAALPKNPLLMEFGKEKEDGGTKPNSERWNDVDAIHKFCKDKGLDINDIAQYQRGLSEYRSMLRKEAN